ncbi:hypothetical protein HN789_06360 [archaeon]|jgi:hypothetical protein|nr:hypothetical protein [archaeon]MBT4022814.1 hypothetical protein [archaeon]MBT4272992.1 hypothetical protein [archaeon]MBT4460917.1 hypothetical protein [archaeon]MBT4858133.1 hypothetical protein [archaeon]
MAQGNPINEIIQMRQQGLSNNQIIQNMQRNGYSNTQIFDAMNQVDTKVAVEGLQPVTNAPVQATTGGSDLFSTPPVGQPEQPQQAAVPAAAPVQPAQDGMQTMQFDSSTPTNNFQTSQVESTSSPQPSVRDIFGENQVKIEELVETIIEEKWEELLRDVSKIVKWKNKVESRISEMEVKIDHLKESFSDLQKAIVGKVGEYDRHIMEVGSEIKAMERVFSKVLPAFTENVSELSDISKRMKEVDKK